MRGSLLDFHTININWDTLLDELKSHHIPGFYPKEGRMVVSGTLDGNLTYVVYFTPQTVTPKEAVVILKNYKFEVFEVPDN